MAVQLSTAENSCSELLSCVNLCYGFSEKEVGICEQREILTKVVVIILLVSVRKRKRQVVIASAALRIV